MKRSRTDLSRRTMLTKTAAAITGAGTILGRPASAGQSRQASGSATAGTPSQAGQTFRAYVRFGTGASVQELKLLPIGPRNVVVRTEAAQICYTTTAQGLGTTPIAQAVVPAHGGVGIVVEIGSKVDRVQVGDRAGVASSAAGRRR
jgi:hypothetical protein